MPPKKQPHIDKTVVALKTEASHALKDCLARINIARRAADLVELHSYEVLSVMVMRSTADPAFDRLLIAD